MGSFIVLVILAVLLWISIPRYNKLRKLKNIVEQERSKVLVQLQRRHDLIDNLVVLVREYARYEGVTISTAIAQRHQPGGVPRLLALAERYPNLRASSNYIQLARDLTASETQIAATRHRLNQAVTNFNNVRNVFPNIILMGWIFRQEKYFETTPGITEPFSARRPFGR